MSQIGFKTISKKIRMKMLYLAGNGGMFYMVLQCLT